MLTKPGFQTGLKAYCKRGSCVLYTQKSLHLVAQYSQAVAPSPKSTCNSPDSAAIFSTVARVLTCEFVALQFDTQGFATILCFLAPLHVTSMAAKKKKKKRLYSILFCL